MSLTEVFIYNYIEATSFENRQRCMRLFFFFRFKNRVKQREQTVGYIFVLAVRIDDQGLINITVQLYEQC